MSKLCYKRYIKIKFEKRSRNCNKKEGNKYVVCLKQLEIAYNDWELGTATTIGNS